MECRGRKPGPEARDPTPLVLAWSENGGNFDSTGSPSSFMFYIGRDGSEHTWLDFGEALSNIFKKHFEAKESVIMVRVKRNTYVVDFRRMIVCWRDRGCIRSIAWVDEAGNRFSPSKPYYCGCWYNPLALDNFTYFVANTVRVLPEMLEPDYLPPFALPPPDARAAAAASSSSSKKD